MAEHEYYTIAFPDNIDLYRLETDNVEFNSFYSDENLLISNSKTTQKKLLSKSQLIFIGKAFQNRIISRNNKVNILQYIFKSVEGAMGLKMRSSRNYRALPFLLALLSIVNGLVESKEAGNNLDDIDWDTELAETVMKIVQYCWKLDDLLLRITCGLIYAKVTKVAEPSSVAKYAENLLKEKSDVYQMPTIIITLGFMYKYNSLESLEPIQVILSNVLVDASRCRENEISSNRLLFLAISMGFRYNGEQFLPIFQQIFPFILLHYLEVGNIDELLYWAMSEWMSTYLTRIVGNDEKKLSSDMKTILFDHYRTFYSHSFPIVNYSKFNLMKAIFTCPWLANSYSCFKNQEIKILAKLKKESSLKTCFFRESQIADMDTAELLINSLDRIKITGLEISFILLNNLNNLNYQLTCAAEIKQYLRTTYQNTMKQLVDSNNVEMEQILYFYQNALNPSNNLENESSRRQEEGQHSNKVAERVEGEKLDMYSFIFSRPILSETQDFINYTFENLLKNINITRFSPSEIVEFSGLVFPFIFRTASSSVKSNREHSIPMLLNVIKKMIHFDETGRLIEQSNNEHNSVVNNFSGQIQAILRFNFRSEFNNSSNTMKKIYEISYLFYKICYKNDKDLFLSQFWLLYDPIFTLTKQKSREDSIYRLRFLSQTLVRLVQDEESSEETLKLLTRKESGPGELLILLEDFLEDTLGVLMSINTQKSQIENLKIRLLNDKMDVGVYIETIPVAISAYVALKSLARTKISEKNERKIKFILSYILVSDSLLRKIVSSLEKMESKAETYDIEKYFEDRKSILSAFNLLVKNNFAFESSELELVYQVMINLIKVGMPEHLKLIKDFCFLALKSSNFPKDRPLLELINQFPKGQVRMAAIMAGLYKAISSQKVEQTEDGSMFDLNLMGETVVYRFVHESTQEEVLSEEMKATLVAILSLDFEVAYKSVVMDWLAKYRSDNRMSSCIYFGLLAKLHTEIASELLVQHLKTDFEMVFSGLVSFSEIVKINKEALLNREQSVVSVFEVCISGILDSLQSKKTEEAQKKLNLVLLCIQTLCDFLAKSSNEQTKKSLIMLTFSANDFLLQKIPAKFFEDKVLCLIESLKPATASQIRSALADHHLALFDRLAQKHMEQVKAKEDLASIAASNKSSVGMKLQLKSFKKR